MLRLVVMASGGGSNFQAILDKIFTAELKAQVVLLISNNRNAGAMEKARRAKVPALWLAPSAFPDETAYQTALMEHLAKADPDLIVLAGYMKRIPVEVIRAYRHRILNIHPALLPAFGGTGMYGHRVHEAAVDYGVKVTGVTVHLVDEEYDHGPIVMQRTVEVLPEDTADTLAERVLKVEHDTYWHAVALFAESKISIQGRKVFVR